LDVASIEKKITPRTKAIVAVDFAGQPCDYKQLKALAKKYNLFLIADACHALGATYRGKKVGGLAELTIFSFHPVKSITTGEGGAILTNNKKLYERLLRLRSHGITKDHNGFNVMTELGYNYRLTDIQAALGVSQLTTLDTFVAKRRAVVEWYREYLSDCAGVILPQELAGNKSAWHIFVARTKKSEDRLPLYQFLQANGIGVNFHYPAVYSHPYYRQHGFATTKLPQMDLYQATAITLPLFPSLKRREVKQVCDIIKKFYDQKV
jgi:dTDP-4-amino-4,6-dideoxygalactose transaminase